MTGLDPTRNVIVEIATLVTDDNLEIVAEAGHGGAPAARRWTPWSTWCATCTPAAACCRPSRPPEISLEKAGQARSTSSAPTCRSAHGPAVRQLDRHRSPLQPPTCRTSRTSALPVGRRVHHQGAGPALGARRRRSRAPQGDHPPGAGRYPESVNELRWYREHLFRIEAGRVRNRLIPIDRCAEGAVILPSSERIAPKTINPLTRTCCVMP